MNKERGRSEEVVAEEVEEEEKKEEKKKKKKKHSTLLDSMAPVDTANFELVSLPPAEVPPKSLHEEKEVKENVSPSIERLPSSGGAQIFQSKTLLISPEEIERTKKEQEEISKWFPTPNVLLRWENVSRTLELTEKKRFQKKVTKKQILFDVSGCVRPGEIMALMGPSGSGKTSLLNVLGGRATSGVTGEITLNGERLVQKMKRKIAYVMQQDIFFESLTVKEQLAYTALLRFPSKMTRENKKKQVDRIIDTLGIAKCADSPIMAISGGERKRVNIGTELLTNPTLLLLDEPTSGLDSTTSAQLMKTLRLLALQGRTILTSIHQPSSQIFFSFDKLLLLADGKTIYCDSPHLALDYFARLGFQSPSNYNPADFIMDLVNSEENPRELLQQKYLEIGKKTLDFPPPQPPSDILLADIASAWPTSYFEQLLVLISRTAKNSKSQLFTFLNFIQSIALAVIVGLCWFQIAEIDSTINDRSGFIFFVSSFWPLQTLFTGLLTFPSEKGILQKERASGSYHLSTYILAKMVSHAPILLLLPAIFSVIAYWMANMHHSFASFVGFLFAELVVVLTGESIGLFIGAVISNLEQGFVLATVLTMGMFLLGGFFVRNLPFFFDWARYLSIFTYAHRASLIMEFPSDRIIPCSDEPLIPACFTQPEVSGSEILDYLGVTGATRSYGFNVGILLIILVIFRFLAYLSLRFFQKGSER